MNGPFIGSLNAAEAWGCVTMALGILMGLVWSRRTGWGCGGLVTPGLMALYAASPVRVMAALVMGLLLAPVLSFVARSLALYGRERAGAAMLLALAAHLALLFVVPSPPWLGWVVPGLIAADAERQGAVMTVCGATSCAIAASFGVGLIRGLLG